MRTVQYILTDHDYDGVSEYHCEPCGRRVGRWSGLVLAEGELEGRYGIGSPVRARSTRTETVEQADRDECPKGEAQTTRGLFGEEGVE
jgi:hypothetical protein